MTGRWLIIKTRAAWAAQAREALDRIGTAHGCGFETLTLRDMHAVDPEAFGLLIQAMMALGAEVDPAMVELARLRDIDEVIW